MSETSPSESPPPASPAPSADIASLEAVVLSREDLWGDAAMRLPNGPTYDFFEALLPPLRYVSAIFRRGGHAVTAHDWDRYMDFADRHLRASS